MIYVFIGGAAGFFVFDLYRIYKTKIAEGRLEITFRSVLGVLVHILVYIAAGLIGVITNLDVLTKCCALQGWFAWNDDITGPIMRAFALGLAGPAGISKGNTRASEGPALDGQAGKQLNTLDRRTSGVLPYLKTLFMR